jgi:hypothetical protein
MLTKVKELIVNYPVTSIITIIVVITVLSLGIGSFVETFNEINAG